MQPTEYPKIYLYRRIVLAKLFIDRHYSQKIHLDDVAREAAFSKYHFIRLFKEIYGKTPHQYLMQRRIDAARSLLETDGMSVLAVCHDVGFESLGSFTSLFKKHTGYTPKSFQLRQRALRRETTRSPLKFVPHCLALQQGWK